MYIAMRIKLTSQLCRSNLAYRDKLTMQGAYVDGIFETYQQRSETVQKIPKYQYNDYENTIETNKHKGHMSKHLQGALI